MYLQHAVPAAPAGALSIQFARHADEVREAQRLRYRVFAEEMGARLASPEPGIDRDLYDPHCEHLLVRERAGGEVVGTYRILTPEGARRLGGYYADDEFDLTRLAPLRDRIVELGRACVHPRHRNGGTITMLWNGLARFLQGRPDCGYLMGCASIAMSDGGHLAASLYNRLARTSLGPIEHRVFPRCALPLERLDRSLPVSVPPLVKGYLRLGCRVSGEPAWDPDFNTADLLLLLPLARLDLRYARHFMRGGFQTWPASA